MAKNNRKPLSRQAKLNITFLVVFILFLALILRLGYLQIIKGKKYVDEVSKRSQIIVEHPVPRGRIFDRNGKIMVDNEAKYAISYTRTNTTSIEEMLSTAQKLSKLITIDVSKLSERDRRDYWVANNLEEAEKLLTKEERARASSAKTQKERQEINSENYKLQLERIPFEKIDNYSEEELQIIAIYKMFNSASAFSPYIVKNVDVTVEELSRVSENLNKLPGVDTLIDWERKYVYDNTLRSILGKVTTNEEGLPKDGLQDYLANGYKRNDKVGKSYLEKQYEEVLRGQKERVIYEVDKSGKISEVVSAEGGERGQDLMLTIDIDLQLAVEQIVIDELLSNKNRASSPYFNRAFVVVLEPNTGEILALVGKQYLKNADTGEYEILDMSLGTFTTAYEMGSSVKGASVLTGYNTKAISQGTVLVDEPLYIAGTKRKSSYAPYNVKGMGKINDLDALRRSSNVYMFKIAIEIGNGNYVRNGPLKMDDGAFDTIRNYFAKFGLGVYTGLDLPKEDYGYVGSGKDPGLLLDLTIGQFDTYTPLQLAQYVSTIANGGNRQATHIVKSIHAPKVNDIANIGEVVTAIEPNTLNTLDNSAEEIERVREGFRQVTQKSGGTAFSVFGKASYLPAGKTGTAESFYKTDSGTVVSTTNLTFASYAPYENPEIAMSVVVPWVSGSSGINLNIAKRVQDYYFAQNEEAEATDAPN